MKNVLETQHLILRPFIPNDLDELYSVLNQPEVWQYDPGRPRSFAQTEHTLNFWINDYERHGFGRLAVIEKDTGKLIGYCGLQWLLLDHGIFKSPEVELFYALSPEYWGKGYMTEAAEAVVHFAFEQLKLKRVVSTAVGPNHRSLGVMKRIGMRIDRDPFDPEWVVGVIESLPITSTTPTFALTNQH